MREDTGSPGSHPEDPAGLQGEVAPRAQSNSGKGSGKVTIVKYLEKPIRMLQL